MPKTATKASKKTNPAPASHSFQKVVLRPGKFRVPARVNAPGATQDSTGRWWKEELFTDERLKQLAENSRLILDAKIKIPAPFAHRDKNKRFVNGVKVGSDGASLVDLHSKPLGWDSSINGGFWDKPLEYVEDCSAINPEFQPGSGLIGSVNTFGDPNDHNTPAGKVSKTVTETSIGLLPSYQPPGWEKPMTDYIAHIAMPVHAIEAGQDNFVAMSNDSSADDDLEIVCMSEMMEPSMAGGEAGETDDEEMVAVLGFLQQLKIDLPPDTTRDNLVERLNLVLRQKIADQSEMSPQNPLTQAPSGSTSKPAPVAMSQENASTDSGKNFANLMLVRETKKTKSTLGQRLNRLKVKGLPKDVADEIEADINAITMSAEDISEDGDFPTSTAETKIALLERTQPNLTASIMDDDMIGMSAPDGSIPQNNGRPDFSGSEADCMDEAQATELLNSAGV